MGKLDFNTWIRFGVWMAIGYYTINLNNHFQLLIFPYPTGFVVYFAYGMWNSSEEYVSRGLIPPSGITFRRRSDNVPMEKLKTRQATNNSD